MPTIHYVEGYAFSFFANEGEEPPHVHVTKGGGEAKYWLSPIEEATNNGFNPGQLRRIKKIIKEKQHDFIANWETFFAK